MGSTRIGGPAQCVRFANAETLCQTNARLPLVKPKRIDAKRAQKVAWSDPAILDKLASAYAQAGGDDEKAARILGVTVGSARLARRRHLGEGASQKAVAAAGMAICVERTPTRPTRVIASVTCCWVAFPGR
jgi:hypothetical protein